MPEAFHTGNTTLNLREILVRGRKLGFEERAKFFSDWLANMKSHRIDGLLQRVIVSRMDRAVRVRDHHGNEQDMLMFGSNSYLGISVHPHVIERVLEAVNRYGVGMGGPPLLNGYSELHRKLEFRLAAYEGTEDAVIYGSGYSANVGLISAIATKKDVVIHDVSCHASFMDGLGLGGHASLTFRHNDMEELEAHLEATHDIEGDRFVSVEGVYSMEGDMAPLDQIVPLCKKYNAILVVDDAHGTGAAGPGGSGSAQQFGVHGDVDIILGSFSKSFSVSGGFVACSKAVADHLRMFSRAYVFSSSIPPMSVAAVHAVLDLLETEPEIHAHLLENISFLVDGLRKIGFDASDATAVFPLPVPPTMNIRLAAHAFHNRGIFLNDVEYPAVPLSGQIFRISLMATHTKDDISQLLSAIKEVWDEFASPAGDGLATPEPAPAAVQPE
ncbi:MAG: aminotransferase class I/II-fold pyridoxal phosphate-dependent enzyme [Bacteroidetes bacterium]|nr:aminotransferase class I/II-fold pyridoxal phosphate-dependent enzyme [Bacteroidota bacterium]